MLVLNTTHLYNKSMNKYLQIILELVFAVFVATMLGGLLYLVGAFVMGNLTDNFSFNSMEGMILLNLVNIVTGIVFGYRLRVIVQDAKRIDRRSAKKSTKKK